MCAAFLTALPSEYRRAHTLADLNTDMKYAVLIMEMQKMAKKTYSIATKITAQDAASGVLRNVQANVDRFSRSAKNATKVNASMWGQMKAYAGGQMLYNTVSRRQFHVRCRP